MMKKQLGFNLVEVLIALIILSVGMLGIAGLYVQSLQAGRTSMFRHHAVTLAGDVADRIRANAGAGDTYQAAGANNNCIGGTVNCSADEMAAEDIRLWQEQALATLPAGDVNVVRDGALTPPEYTITVSWEEPGETQTYAIVIPVSEP